jgi:uncharacterized iron-regulated membrane protein
VAIVTSNPLNLWTFVAWRRGLTALMAGALGLGMLLAAATGVVTWPRRATAASPGTAKAITDSKSPTLT